MGGHAEYDLHLTGDDIQDSSTLSCMILPNYACMEFTFAWLVQKFKTKNCQERNCNFALALELCCLWDGRA